MPDLAPPLEQAPSSPTTAQLVAIAVGEGCLGGVVPSVLFHPLVELVHRGSPWSLLPPALTSWLSAAGVVALIALAWRLRTVRPVDPTSTGGLLVGVVTTSLVAASALGLLSIMLAAFLLPVLLIASLVYTAGPPDRARRRALISVTCLAVVISVLATAWPLRAAVALSRSGLDGLATQVEAGRPLSRPTVVGVMLVRETQLRSGVPFLVLDPDPSGPKGLARVGASEPARHFNLSHAFAVDGAWHWISED